MSVDQGSYVELAPEWGDDGWFKFPRSFIRDRRLSWEARAVAAWMASHKTAQDGDGAPFRFDVPYIVRSGPSGRDKVRRILRELESLGYLERQREREQGLYGPIKHVLHPVPIATEFRTEFSPTMRVQSRVQSVQSRRVQQNRRSQPAPENPSPDKPSPDNPGGQEREHEVQIDAVPGPPTPPAPQLASEAAETNGTEQGGGEVPSEVWDMLAGIPIPAGKRAPGRRSKRLVQVAERCAAILHAPERYGLRLGDLRQHLAADLDTVRHSIVGCWIYRLTDDELPHPRTSTERPQSNAERRAEQREREQAADDRAAEHDGTQPQQHHHDHQARHAQRDMDSIRATALANVGTSTHRQARQHVSTKHHQRHHQRTTTEQQ